MSKAVRFVLPLSAALLLVAGVAHANLALDGDMEAASPADPVVWQPYAAGVFAKTGDVVYNGTQSMAITQAGALGGFHQVGLAVEPGKTYRLKFQYWRVSGTFTMRVGLGTSSGDFQNNAFQSTAAQAGWSSFARTFTLPAALPGPLRLVFLCSGTAYIDDVSLTEHNLVKDGTMEAEGTASWVNYSTATYGKSEDAAYNGSQSMFISAAGGFQQRAIPLEQYNSYRLTVWYRREAGTFYARLGNNTSNVDSFGGGLTDGSSPLGSWVRHTRTFTPTAAIGDVRLVFFSRGSAYVDDVSIVPLELVEDWNCEAAGTDAWRIYYAPVAYQKTIASVYQGTRSLHLVSGGLQQVGLQVKAGATYTLSVWYKAIAGVTQIRLGTYSSNYDFEGKGLKTRLIRDWTEYRRTFTVPADFSDLSRFRLVISSSGEALFDNLSIRPN